MSKQQFGITLGNTFIGLTTGKSVVFEPFDTSVETGDGSKQPQTVTATSVEDLINALSGQYSTKNLIELFSTIPEVFAPIDAWASRVALGKFGFRKRSTKEVITGRPELDVILNSPNPMQTFRDLIYEYVCYMKVTGENYVYSSTPKTLKRVDYKNIINTYNLPSDATEPNTNKTLKLFTTRDKNSLINSFTVMKGTTEEFTVDSQNVLFITQPNLKWKGRKLRGYPPLLSAKKALMNLVAVYEARHVIYVKRGALGAIISKRTDAGGGVALKNSEKRKILEDINQLQGVTKGKYPYSVVSTPIDFVRFAMSIQELMPFEETLADAAAIYATLGVPRELMPKNSDSTYANQRDAEKNFIQTRIAPLGEAICHALSVFWDLHTADIEMFVDYSELPSLQENKKEKAEVDNTNAKTQRMRFLSGIITLNDWRVSDKLEKISNPLYDKLIFDMDDTQRAMIKLIFELLKSSDSSKQNNNGNGNGN